MKNMSEENINGSAQAGSPSGPANDGKAGEPQLDLSKYVPKEDYDELHKRFGAQGSELGDYREFVRTFQPVFDKLESDPVLLQAILEDKLDGKLVDAVLKGEVSTDTAKTVTQVNKDIKKELGDKKYNELSPEQLEKLISEKVKESVSTIQDGLEKRFNEDREIRSYEEKISNFIKNTPDFEKYAPQINEWIDEHPEQLDIEVAYQVVKGRVLSEKNKNDDETALTEDAKTLANAGAGGSQSSGTITDPNVVDSLISNRSNPNII